MSKLSGSCDTKLWKRKEGRDGKKKVKRQAKMIEKRNRKKKAKIQEKIIEKQR